MQRAELVLGLASGVMTVTGWVYALFGQTGRWESTEMSSDGGVISTQSGATSLWGSQDLHPITLMFLLLLLLCAFGVMAGAYFHGRHGLPSGLALLWISTVLLLGGATVSLLSVGLLLMPGALLALAAAVVANFSGVQDHTETHR